MSKKKKLENMSFEELVDHATLDIHLGLMKSCVHLWLDQAIRWNIALDQRNPNKKS